MESNDSGIYKITNIINNKVYIGSAVSFYFRKSYHFSMLKYNKHFNQHLQRAYNKYGVENFIFEIIEYIERTKELENIDVFKKVLLNREDYWINFYRDNFGKESVYNIRERAHNNLGLKWTDEMRKNFSESVKGEKNHQYGKSPSPETRKKQSDALTGKYMGINNLNYGKRRTEQEKKIMSDIRKGINNYKTMKKEVVLQIKEMLNNQVMQIIICKELNVSKSTVRKVKIGFYDNIYKI